MRRICSWFLAFYFFQSYPLIAISEHSHIPVFRSKHSVCLLWPLLPTQRLFSHSSIWIVQLLCFLSFLSTLYWPVWSVDQTHSFKTVVLQIYTTYWIFIVVNVVSQKLIWISALAISFSNWPPTAFLFWQEASYINVLVLLWKVYNVSCFSLDSLCMPLCTMFLPLFFLNIPLYHFSWIFFLYSMFLLVLNPCSTLSFCRLTTKCVLHSHWETSHFHKCFFYPSLCCTMPIFKIISRQSMLLAHKIPVFSRLKKTQLQKKNLYGFTE